MRFAGLNRAVITIVATGALLGGLELAATPKQEGRSPLRTFFVFESEVWLETRGAKLVLQPLSRHPANPVIPRGEQGAPDSHRVGITTVLPEGDRLRAWYGAMRTPTKGRSYDLHDDIAIGYAESRDGVAWEKPRLNLIPGEENLLIHGAFYMTVHPDPEHGYRAAIIFYRPDVGTPGAEAGATLGMSTSRDGLHWSFEQDPAISIRHFESYGLFHRDGHWWVLGQGVPPFFPPPAGSSRRVMYGFHSEDGEGLELYPRPLFQYEGDTRFPDGSMQTHVGAGIWDRGRVLLGFSGHFWPGGFSATASYSIGLLYSYDGIKWAEPFPKTPIFFPSARGNWDGGWVFQVQRPVSRGDTTYFYYVGADRGNEWAARSALGLATLGRDRFAAYLPGEESEANLITVPIRLQGQESVLYLNAKGPLKVQLLDTYLRPLSEGVGMEGDKLRVAIMDLRDRDLAQTFRLSFTLSPGSELYTFALGPPESKLPPLSAWE